MSGTSAPLQMPPASGEVIDIVPRQDGQGGLGSGTGTGIGSGDQPGMQGAAAPQTDMGNPISPAPAGFGESNWPDVDAATSAYELRWMERRGLLQAAPPPGQPTGEVRNQPDAAGFDALQSQGEPRRGTMRLSPSGGPQQHPAAPPQQPQMQGPQQPAEPVGAQLVREEVTNLLLAMRQGVTSSALLSAEPVTDPEIERVLNRPDDGDPDTEAGRLAVARERASELGLDVVFRAGRDGRIEAVARTPEMQAAGGQLGQIADGIGRLLGMGFVDPLGGAAMAAAGAQTRIGQRAATVGSLVMSSGGAGSKR